MARPFSSGARFQIFDRIDSTNLEARRVVEAGEKGPLWLIARLQTAGYGRRGSSWLQREGDVAATLLYSPPAERETIAQLSFVAALAVVDALKRTAPHVDFAVKWPNDILVDGRKIAGLLLELLTTPPASPLVAFGIGVNVVSAPEHVDYPTACLCEFVTDATPEPVSIVEAIDECLFAWVRRWKDEGFEPVRARWLQIADCVGRRVRVRLPDETVEGVFSDLDLDGALILDCDGERRKIAAGAVLPPG